MPIGLLNPAEEPSRTWEHVTMDFVTALPKAKEGYDSCDQKNWADFLPLLEISYNNSVHTATCVTPLLMNTGQNPLEFADLLISDESLRESQLSRNLSHNSEI